MPKVSVWVLHAGLSQSRRTTTTDEYRKAKNGILLATDIVARGMDFPGVTSVFQVGIPFDRSGISTARGGRPGRALRAAEF